MKRQRSVVSKPRQQPEQASNADELLGQLAWSERDLDRLGLLSRKTRWRLRRDGRFPEPREVGGRKLYDADEIRAWWANPNAWAERHG